MLKEVSNYFLKTMKTDYLPGQVPHITDEKLRCREVGPSPAMQLEAPHAWPVWLRGVAGGQGLCLRATGAPQPESVRKKNHTERQSPTPRDIWRALPGRAPEADSEAGPETRSVGLPI